MSKKWGKQWHTFIIQMIQIQIQVHTVSINHSRESLSPCLISVSIAHTYTQNDTHKRHFFTYTCFSEFKDFLSRIAGSRTFFSYFFMILAQNDEQLAFLDILDTHTHKHTHTHYCIPLNYLVSHILTSCCVSFQRPEGNAELSSFDMQRKHFRHRLTEWAAVWDQGVVESYSPHALTFPLPCDFLLTLPWQHSLL